MSDLPDRLQHALGDRYRIEGELGGGGMGVVFLAADLKLDRPVAVKVLRPEIAQAVGKERFLREIHISAQLCHPHILSLIDTGAADGLLYYVMFYVPGETLRSRLTRELQLPVDEAVRIALQVADALDHAHRQGVVHGDVKLENILLEEEHALVCYFGIARAIGEAGGEGLTGTGELEVDHRADIYALGCVLYEMLIGTPPLGGATPQVRRDGTELRQLTSGSAIDRLPRWSPDGTRIAYFSGRDTSHTWVINADGSGNRQLTDLPGSTGVWSPDGRRIALNNFSDVAFLIDPSRSSDEQQPKPLVRDSAWGPFVANDWSPDGTRLAGMVGWSDRGVGYYELATGKHVRLTDFGQWPVWMPDSRRILFVSGKKAFYLVDSQTGKVKRVYSTVRDVLGPPRVTADGPEVVYSRRVTEGDIWLVTIDNPKD
jgi:serine/threonine protein kinase